MHHSNLAHMHMLDRAFMKSESEIQEKQSSGKYGGPQAYSCGEANIFLFLSKESAGASHQYYLTILF
jgi:hypothetical protein